MNKYSCSAILFVSVIVGTIFEPICAIGFIPAVIISTFIALEK